MAETKTKAVKTASKSAAAAKAPAEEDPQVREAPKKEAQKQAYKVRKQLDPHAIVTVKNGFPGMLIYESSKTGEMFRWESLGDEQDTDGSATRCPQQRHLYALTLMFLRLRRSRSRIATSTFGCSRTSR